MKRRICDICKKPIYNDKLYFGVYLFRPKKDVYEPSHPRKKKKEDICVSCWNNVIALINVNLLKEDKDADTN